MKPGLKKDSLGQSWENDEKKKMAENLPNPESNLDIQVHEVHKSTNLV